MKYLYWQSNNPQLEMQALTELGFVVNERDGSITSFNANIFAKYITAKYDICFSSDGNFYEYCSGVWIKMDNRQLLSTLRNEIQSVREDIWLSIYEYEYIKTLQRELLAEKPFNYRKSCINLENGMYKINKSKLCKHNQKYYSTIRIPITYSRNAACPNFIGFLKQVFEGDLQRIQLAKEWFGYCLSTDTSAQKALILYGTGGNGKGVFTTLLTDLIGSANTCNIPLSDLGRSFSRVRLYNKAVNISSENEISGKGLNTQYFKAIVGGDEIEAEEKGKQSFNFKPSVKLIFSLNSLPSTRDKTEGFFRRLSILHFSAFFSESERDTKLIKKLRKELAGILNWAVEGLDELRSNGYIFSKCKSCDAMIMKYKEELSPVFQFYDECVIETDNAKIANSDVLKYFHQWANFNGYKSYAGVSAKKFWNEFESTCREHKLITHSRHSGNCRYHTGFELSDEEWES